MRRKKKILGGFKMEKTIRIFGKEKTVENEGKKNIFVSFSYTKDGETFFQVKFNQECENVPKKAGYWKITVDTEDVSIQKGKINKNGNKNNDILWISNILKKEKDEAYEKEVAEKRAKRVQEVLD